MSRGGRRARLIVVVVAGLALASASAWAAPPEGDDVEIGAKPAPPQRGDRPATAPLAPNAPVATFSPPPASAAEIGATRQRLAAAEARIATLEAEAERPSWAARLLPPGFAIGGYVQGQYEHHGDSQDEVLNGTYLNQDRFVLRRGRLRFDAQWQYAEMDIEPDMNTVKSPVVTIRRAEATLLLRSTKFDGVVVRHGVREAAPPVAALTVGVTDIPFGFEMLDAPRDRVFMERTQGSLALFPTESDVSARLWGGAGFFRYNIAVSNGEPLAETSSKLPGGDPTASKDFIARVGVDVAPRPWSRLLAGVSVLRGKGFHAGSQSTKSGVVWTDLNENSVIDPGELTAAPGTSAEASIPFDRWAVGGDAVVLLDTPIGKAMIYGEIVLASNLDRGLYVADPTGTGIDVRELAFYGAITQQVTKYGLVGLRVDAYDPNADSLDASKGKLLPTSAKITTFSPVIGLTLPAANCLYASTCERARLLFQYDVVRDNLGRDARGVPTDLANDRWTVRLQVQM